MSIIDTIATVAARLAKPPSRRAEGAELESITACSAHNASHRVPCLEHTPEGYRRARAKAMGVVR